MRRARHRAPLHAHQPSLCDWTGRANEEGDRIRNGLLAQVVQAFVQRQGQFAELHAMASHRAEARGLTLPDTGGFDRLLGLAQAVLGRAYTVLGYPGIIAVLVLLGLREVPAFAAKLRGGWTRRSGARSWARCRRLRRSSAAVSASPRSPA
jgi:hypothetical protein